ncbi:hypothetical protein AAES_49991 [Amazona aestiva]|uniref:Uncharacterized protein n=1 Tax=Amazona aestiva TaxID=12930 RepID=A0A0Q3MP34_AMAAE|nr:hypothetical protein AAES_49991 [Amazona aestiva]
MPRLEMAAPGLQLCAAPALLQLLLLCLLLRAHEHRYQDKEEEMDDVDRDLGDDYGSEVAGTIELANCAAQRETQKEGAAFVAAALKETVSLFKMTSDRKK